MLRPASSSEALRAAAAALAATNAAALAATPAAPDFSHLPSAEAEAARKAWTRQTQREREWHARQRLKAFVAIPEFDGNATTDFYGFGKVLGQGSFGEVRLAWHRLAGQRVAIKSYEKAKLMEPNHWRRVQQEIRLMERLNHPHIIREFEMIDSPRRIHIVMEYVGGGNLCSYVKERGRLSETEARVLFLQLLAGLEYMHDCCIIHRDIKCVPHLQGAHAQRTRANPPPPPPSSPPQARKRAHRRGAAHCEAHGLWLQRDGGGPQQAPEDFLWHALVHGARDHAAARVPRAAC
jgi:hypothetical protein